MTRLDELETLVQAQSQQIEKLLQDYQKVQHYAHWLEEQLKLNKQRLYGRSSEVTDALQLALFDEAECEPLPSADDDTGNERILVTQQRAKKHRGRKIDTSRLPRERCVHDLPADEKICGCGCVMEKIGEDVTEQIDYIPAVFKIIEHVTPKYVCRPCNQIKAASKPESSPIPKSMATAGLIAEVIIEKYEHHLPLYRQEKIFLQYGAEIPANTLGNWVMQGAEVLSPLGDILFNQINKISVLQADETPVKVLKPDKQGYFWGFHSCDPGNRFIVFEFSLSRAARVANQRLKNFQGTLQTDGYSGYNELRRRTGIIAIGCWDHARRKFVEVIKVSHSDQGMAGKLLALINRLYEVERSAKELSAQQRRQLRQEHSRSVLDEIYALAVTVNAPPKSGLGGAITYLLNNRIYLCEYVNHGEAEMTNCWIENQIRPFALGRRNWLFLGNEVSANKAALLYSLIQTCKMNQINPRDYLTYVLKQVHKMRRKQVDPISLLPQFIDKNLFKSQ